MFFFFKKIKKKRKLWVYEHGLDFEKKNVYTF